MAIRTIPPHGAQDAPRGPRLPPHGAQDAPRGPRLPPHGAQDAPRGPRLGRRDVLTLAGLASLSSLTNAESRPMIQPAGPDDRRRALYALLGDLPDRHRPIKGAKRQEAHRDGYVLETWDLDLNGIEMVPAYVARPESLKSRAPAVLFNHSHGGGYKIGKQEFVDGREYLQPVPYAKALTGLGYVALCIDHWVFGERSHTTELDTFKAMLWQGQVLWGMMVYDSLRALDWLVDRADVDRARVATLGISMGSTMAWWVAALDERVKVTVDICCLTDFHTLLAQKGLSGHGVYYYVPGLLKHFTTSQINALIAPRAHLGLAGLKDKLTPVEGLDIIDRELTRVYTEQKHPERWKLLRYDVGHMETAEGRQEIIAFLNRFL
jgi:acetyl esterase/lipase